jgi:hypothetical protein
MNIRDILDSLDWIGRLTGVVFAWQHADWRNQIKRHGVIGILREAASAATLHNAPTIYVSRESSWSGRNIERLLKRHGVRLSDRGVNSTHIHFRVEQRQHEWALYVLRRAGVPVELDGDQSRATASAERYAPGDVPANHSSWHHR